jgi:hypothetical protein
MEKKQTAVEWFYQRILAKDIQGVFEQAKKMEKDYHQKLADDAFRLGWESHKTFTS